LRLFDCFHQIVPLMNRVTTIYTIDDHSTALPDGYNANVRMPHLVEKEVSLLFQAILFVQLRY